jgi:hypothetical protein
MATPLGVHKNFGLILSHDNVESYVDNLPLLLGRRRKCFTPRQCAPVDRDRDNLVWIGYLRERLANSIGLTPRLPASGTTLSNLVHKVRENIDRNSREVELMN